MKFILKYLVFIFIITPIILIGLFKVTDSALGLNNYDVLKDKITSQIDKVFKKNDEAKDTVKDDGKLLVLEVADSPITIVEDTMSLVIKANKDIKVNENERFKLVFVKDEAEFKYYVLEISNIAIGESTIRLTISDNSGYAEDFALKVTRERYVLAGGGDHIEPWPDTVYEVDGGNLAAWLSKARRLPNTYAPDDLVDLHDDKGLITNLAGLQLREEAADSLVEMLNDMQTATGRGLAVASAYRAYNTQVKVYSGWLKDLGQVEADKVSARPGYSEHQLGTVVDFITKETNYELSAKLDETAQGKWLLANSHKYGFIQTYPKGSTAKTGYAYEAWHYRYIGVDNAARLKASGKVFNEWVAEEQEK